MSAARSVLAAPLVAGLAFAAWPALAYHPSHDGSMGGGGSFSLEAVLPIAIVFVVAVAGFVIWERKMRKTKPKRGRKRKSKRR